MQALEIHVASVGWRRILATRQPKPKAEGDQERHGAVRMRPTMDVTHVQPPVYKDAELRHAVLGA